jgi:3-isopropylmalate dehydratase
MTLEDNVKEFGITYFGLDDQRQGIVHIIGPEQGFTLPGTTVVYGDSHTSTHGAFGALAFGIRTSEVEHVLETQTLITKRSKNMRIQVDGELSPGVSSKDIILYAIGKIGTAGGTGAVIEYCGSAIRGLSMEARMSICNTSIEGGARAGMIAPDETSFAYLKDRPLVPKYDSPEWKKAVKYWTSLQSDPGAKYDIDVFIDAKDIVPTVSWGTSPEDVVPIMGSVLDPETFTTKEKKEAGRRKLEYMGLKAGTKMEDIELDKIFVGSCTNARIEDLRAAAQVVKGRKVASNIKRAMIVPGSGLVKRQAEAEDLDTIFTDAGFEWREAGCSMCLGMNHDILAPRERCASTSNRNFEGRQGAGGRTHLMSPVMAAACAIVGKLTDVRKLAKHNATPRKASPKPVIITKGEIDERVETDDDERELIGDQPEDQGPQVNTMSHGTSAGLPKIPNFRRYFCSNGACKCRYRCHHPQAISRDYQAYRSRRRTLPFLTIQRGWLRKEGLHPQPRTLSKSKDPSSDRPQFWLRQLKRTRPMGSSRFRHQVRHRTILQTFFLIIFSRMACSPSKSRTLPISKP